ncbi:MAG TPA: DUF924 family protein [Rubrivivax sp.]|nr:DUF924 family protein [Rubrivivax sp.]
MQTNTAQTTSPEDVIAFWREAGPARWFAKDAAFDAHFRDRFQNAHLAAARRELDSWAATAAGSLALLILLDQFPRNSYRGSAHMFATDGLARYFARRALEARQDAEVDAALRSFCYLPFMHSEDLSDQELSMRLQLQLGPNEYAVNHRDIIERFGRFPHRNHLLGRQTTSEEAAYLDGGGFKG